MLKPAETTPLTALKLAELIRDADLPPGVVNIVTGAGETGAALVNHPDVDKIAFTGSTEVGKMIQKPLAGTSKKHYTLELGGKAANIIFADAALDQAVEGIINGIFFNQGHVCCAGSRLLVQESVADEVIAQAQGPDGDADRRRSARQEHRHRRDQFRSAARRRSRSTSGSARPRAPRCAAKLLRRARAPATGAGRRSSPACRSRPRRAGRDLRPGARDPDLPHLRGGDREGEQHAVRIVGRRLDRQGREDLPNDPRRSAPASSGRTPTTSSTRPRPFGGYKESGMGREGGLHGLDAYVELT